MPKILFDDQIFRQQRFGGISRYFGKLIQLISLSKEYKILPNHYFTNNFHLIPQKLSWYSVLYSMRQFKGKARVINYIIRKKERSFKRTLEAGQYDIFHPSYYDDGFVQYLPKMKPFVLTVYDMIHELYYDPYYKTTHLETKQKAHLIPKAAHIIAISEHTKKDILSLFPEISSNKISVIHLGYSKEPSSVTANPIASNYILYVGGRWLHKNFEWTVGAIEVFLKEHNFLLICAGGGPFSNCEVKMLNNLHLNAHVLYYDISNDDFLNDLYNGAFCFIFPSFYEGFGLPVLEAFANNCPVILSNATCFPEIGGSGALYFELDNPGSLLCQLNLLFDKDVRINLINAGNERLKNFSWQKMAEEHCRVYKSVIAQIDQNIKV